MSESTEWRLLRLATAFSFLLALVNSLLRPKAYAATQLLFDYELGFTRRGLAGEILNLFVGDTVSQGEIFAASAVISLIGALTIYWFLGHMLGTSRSAYLIAILAFNSFAFASLVGSPGYLDAVLLAITLIALATNAAKPVGFGLRLVVVVVGVLFHENMLPYFAVLMAFDIWLARRSQPLAIPLAILPVVVGFATVGLLGAFAQMSPEQAAQFANILQSKAAFGVDPKATEVAGRTLIDNFELMREMRATKSYWAWVLFDGVPLFLMSLWLLWLGLRVLGKEAGAMTQLLLLGAIIGPLSLNLIAFDVVRFGTISVLAGFAALALIIRHYPESKDRLSSTLSWPVFTVVLILNANITTMHISEGSGHITRFPWVLLKQLEWLTQ